MYSPKYRNGLDAFERLFIVYSIVAADETHDVQVKRKKE